MSTNTPTPVYPVTDRKAARVAGIMGLPAPSTGGHCHYRGLPLNWRGDCEECR